MANDAERQHLLPFVTGWHILGNNPDTADVTTFYADKSAVLFSPSGGFGNGGSTYMGQKPLGDKPAPLNRRGYHYTTDGSTLDVWQWEGLPRRLPRLRRRHVHRRADEADRDGGRRR